MKTGPRCGIPLLQGFQDRAYMLAAKCEISKKFNWDSSMYTYIHTPYIPPLVTTFLCKNLNLNAYMACYRVCTNLSHYHVIFFVLLLQRKYSWEKLRCIDTISSVLLGQCTMASHMGPTIYHSKSSFK